jgi:hypothetical protein
MNPTELQPAFNELVDTIQSIVNECKAHATPSSMLIKQRKVLDPAITETGISVSRTEERYFQKGDWFKSSLQACEKAKLTPQYETFREGLSLYLNKNHDERLAQATLTMVQMASDGKTLLPHDLLNYFLKSIANEPIPAWVNIDVHGVSVKNTPSIVFALENRCFTFRQLIPSDYEYESYISLDSRFGLVPPNSILKIEMNARQGLDLQIETLKMTTLLRLFRVCSAQLDRLDLGSKSPFGMIIGTITTLHNKFPPTHPIILTDEIAKDFQRFLKSVEPRLPSELKDFGSQKVTTISIAYERYCDSLLISHPVERKIAFAIMGLEAIYLRENEVQELMYRLELRVRKLLSALSFDSEKTRLCIKEGYKVRNSYVHGGKLSDKERKRIEKMGITIDELASGLLDYLRISILHLIISGQNKSEYLDLLEDSFIEKSPNDALHLMMEDESNILRI